MKKPVKFSEIDGGVAAPKDFFATGLSAGLKRSKKKDIALVYSSKTAVAAGVFTKNRVKAAPVILSAEVAKRGVANAVIINSGNANACTGKQGMEDAKTMAKAVAETFRTDPSKVFVASTGIIGVPLPIKKITGGIWAASRMIYAKTGHSDAAEAIMTTDLTRKEIAVSIPFGKGKEVRIGAMAKGSGMIAPNMGTMICVITTDAVIDKMSFRKAILAATERTFNMITVDNDTSTNDCVLAMANGASGQSVRGAGYRVFQEALEHVCRFLAREIAKDGEGATRLITVNVTGARTAQDAAKAARSVAGSSLVKCAVYGADPNIGRILAAAGYSGAEFDPDKIEVSIEREKIVKKGVPVAFDHHKASELMKKKEVTFNIDLKGGNNGATAWGCDMTEGYIKINALYHT